MTDSEETTQSYADDQSDGDCLDEPGAPMAAEGTRRTVRADVEPPVFIAPLSVDGERARDEATQRVPLADVEHPSSFEPDSSLTTVPDEQGGLGLAEPGTARMRLHEEAGSRPSSPPAQSADDARSASAFGGRDSFHTEDVHWTGPDQGGRGLRPARGGKASHGAAMYRIEPTDLDSLVRFGETALRARGVFIRTHDVRPPGTHAVACVVHPLSQDEFHLVGQVVSLPAQDTQGIGLQFLEIDEHTDSQYRYFVALGISSEGDQDVADVTLETDIDGIVPQGPPTAAVPSGAEEAVDFPSENTIAVGFHEIEIVDDSDVDELALATSHEKTERVQRSEYFSDENDESY